MRQLLTDGHNVVHPHSGISFKHKKERQTNRFYSIIRSERSQSPKKCPEKANKHRQKVDYAWWGDGRIKQMIAQGLGFLLGVMKCSTIYYGWLYIPVNILKTTGLYTYLFYTSKTHTHNISQMNTTRHR